MRKRTWFKTALSSPKKDIALAETEDPGVMSLTVTLLTAYFANNTVPNGDLPTLVAATRQALLGDLPVETPAPVLVIEEVAVIEEIVPEPPKAAPGYKPAVSIEDSLTSPDQILSLIDGKPYKALKRHLSTHGLTPAEYRSRYDLPADYPMVAPSYSAARREVALKLGLGGKRKAEAPSPAPAPAVEAASVSPAVEAVESVVTDTAPAKPARHPRTKAAPVETKPAPGKPKRKSAAKKTPAASEVAAPKPKRSKTVKAAIETPAPADAEVETVAAN